MTKTLARKEEVLDVINSTIAETLGTTTEHIAPTARLIDDLKCTPEELFRILTKLVKLETIEDFRSLVLKGMDFKTIVIYAEEYQALVALLSDSLGVAESEIFPESMLSESLGCDSADALDIMFRIEKEFGIPQPETKELKGKWYKRYRTVHAVFQYILGCRPSLEPSLP